MRKGAALLLLFAGGCYLGPPRYYPGPPAAKPAPPPAPPVKPAPAPTPTPARAPAPAAQPAPATPSGTPRMIAEPEAIAVGTDYARSHGFPVSRVKHVHLDGAGRWHVELQGEGGRDVAKVLVDGWTGQVLKANLKGEDE
jgi:hypothetical protein